METYYAYLRWCRDYNERNLIDPTSDKMEWHHTLPKHIFGDIRIGLWLTIRQHAIATALQSLAFGYNCLCFDHTTHLPSELRDLCFPILSRDRSQQGKVGGPSSVSKKVGIHNPKNKEIILMLDEGKNKIINYYSTQCDFILKQVNTLTEQYHFDEAIYNLMLVPEICKDCYFPPNNNF
jgi:hypothetical protein